jgi:uncharacterized membrane protein
MSDSFTYARAVAIGIIAGMRSMSAPALVSNHLAHDGSENLPDNPLMILASPKTARVLKILAIGEMVADKLPIVPARVSAGPLVARVISGGVSGAAVCGAAKGRTEVGALLGGLAAIAGAYGFYHLRRRVGQETAVPDPVLGMAEDAIVVVGGRMLLSQR